MFGKRFPLITLWGFPVYVDVSWLFLALFFTWTLATGFFPYNYTGFDAPTYWLMGLIATLGLVVSVVLHEFSHSAVARHYGLPIGGITLFIFGGVAEMTEEPKTPKVEFLMAIAGPIASVVLGIFFYFLTVMAQLYRAPVPTQAVLEYLGLINIVLAIFNMIPAFPMDGGRVLRSILWAVKNNIDWATRIASRIGNWFGTALLLLGVLSMITGNVLGGIWWVLIGLFLKSAAKNSYQQVVLRHELEDIPVRELMKRELVAIPPDSTLRQALEAYFYRYFYRDYPVVDEGQLQGYINLDTIRENPRNTWARLKVGDVMEPASLNSSVPAGMSAMEALSMLEHSHRPNLVVTENDTIVGIISKHDLMRYISLKTELDKAS